MFGTENRRGVSKEDAAQRNYFDILGRHFWHICGVSFWFALSNLLFFGASIYLFSSYFGGDNLVTIVTAFLSGKSFIVPIVPFLPLMLTGPFTAGFTYVIRNYAKQEHTFIVSDFFEHAKKNWKFGLLTSVLSYLVMYLLLQALVFYNGFFISSGLPLGVLYTVFAVVSILLIIMSFYVYPILVTFKMKYRTVLKNAWTFAVLKLPQNLIIFVLLFAINAGLFYLSFFVWMLPEIWFILMAFFLTGFTAFTANYYIWHVLDKYIVRLVTPKKDDDRIFTDEEHLEDDDFDDYVEDNYDENDF